MEELKTKISREKAIVYGREAVEIIELGRYSCPSGRKITITDYLERSLNGTKPYSPELSLPQRCAGSNNTKIEIVNELLYREQNALVGCELQSRRTKFCLGNTPRWRLSLGRPRAGGISCKIK